MVKTKICFDRNLRKRTLQDGSKTSRTFSNLWVGHWHMQWISIGWYWADRADGTVADSGLSQWRKNKFNQGAFPVISVMMTTTGTSQLYTSGCIDSWSLGTHYSDKTGSIENASSALWGCWKIVQWLPFFFEQVEGKSLSSTFTEGLLHFILQKKERRAPEHNRDGPGVISVLTGSPAANQYTKWDKPRVVSSRRGLSLAQSLFFPALPL